MTCNLKEMKIDILPISAAYSLTLHKQAKTLTVIHKSKIMFLKVKLFYNFYFKFWYGVRLFK